ncbi:maltodextrin phosphorylase [Anaerobacterium chartisolvens]|uniref:Maltodextrin phosphorylase n=1 Tax=Anaerobacterium chartisolvens TaxID=1297424 RepID=A0A369BE46_9FIRM|nr:alpha-glucan family phosphorylase [Anaerobacterium chartisolvens]RCX17944.1 maltodextrin phosphorylase [Anaerobacterium chartisolvens]
MYILGKITVTAVLPDRLKKLRDMAYNLWWTWNADAIDLYREIDIDLWERLNKNPVSFLQEVSQKKLEQKLMDEGFLARYDKTSARFDSYISSKDTWFNQTYPAKNDFSMAYFSAEYGLNEVLPIYSGGLGVLSGDHCKSASDLGLPFTAVGLFYKQGYFSQHINRDGWQETKFTDLNVSQLPIRPALDSENRQVTVSVELPGRLIYVKVWEVKVGRISLFLMDSDVEQNSSSDRMLTARLYGGDQETRIQQEIILGIGGFRALQALGVTPRIYHMNEGHSSFLGLEIIRRLVQEKGLSFNEAKELALSSLVFTTHTPVPAGNDVFPLHMIDKYFGNYWGSLGISRHEFLDLGMKINDNHNFNMTVLALTLAGRKNGVSELHGAVSRNIFGNVWPGVPEDEVPIGHITNGVHTMTWLSPSIKELYDRYLSPGWEENSFRKEIWSQIDDIPDELLWQAHCRLKSKMIEFVRSKLKQQRSENGESSESIREVDTLLDPDALTLGFARRFATYKRANLIFRDAARIQKIMNDPKRPVQIIFAGKAHPADSPAHDVIKNINDIARQEGFNGKVILVENYNMTLARNLVQGVDIWLNNPRRPLEASGTSGQKVCINGIVNFSILDGWWCEGYNGKNGWVIGDDSFYDNEHYQDNADSQSIYEILGNEIVPLFYDRDDKGVPVKWVQVMKESIKSLVHNYGTHRMVQDYTNKMYIPSFERLTAMSSDNYARAKDLAHWKLYMAQNWPHLSITAEKDMSSLKEQKAISGETISICASVYPGGIDPSNIDVQLYYGCIGKNGMIENPEVKSMHSIESPDQCSCRYCCDISITEGGQYGYTVRVVPRHKDLISKFDIGLIKWVVE